MDVNSFTFYPLLFIESTHFDGRCRVCTGTMEQQHLVVPRPSTHGVGDTWFDNVGFEAHKSGQIGASGIIYIREYSALKFEHDSFLYARLDWLHGSRL